MNYSKFLSLSVLVLCSLITTAQNDFSFIFYTDLHLKADSIPQQGYENCIEKMNKLSPDFVVDGGDFIFEMNRRDWQTVESSYQLYSVLQKRINAPVYQVIGNHDALGVDHKVKRKVNKDIQGKELFRQTTGRNTYYSFDHKGWQFIALDCLELNKGYRKRMANYKISDEQLVWLSSILDTIPNEKPIVLMAHVPFMTATNMYKKGSREKNNKGQVIWNTNAVLDLCKKHNLKLTLSGHLHQHEEIHIDSKLFINGGSVSGRWWKGAYDNTPNGFTKIDIVNGEAHVSYLAY